MHYKEVAVLSIVVSSDLIEVTLEHDAELGRKHFILTLFCSDVHHLNKLRCRVLLDLEYE